MKHSRKVFVSVINDGSGTEIDALVPAHRKFKAGDWVQLNKKDMLERVVLSGSYKIHRVVPATRFTTEVIVVYKPKKGD